MQSVARKLPILLSIVAFAAVGCQSKGLSSQPPAGTSSAAPSSAPSVGTLAKPAAPASASPSTVVAVPAQEATGDAAVVWVASEKAPGGYRSVWIEPGPAGARVVAERGETVFVGPGQLWVLSFKPIESVVCADCEGKRMKKVASQQVALKSLKTGGAITPWGEFKPWRDGCEAGDDGVFQGESFWLEVMGGVGDRVFATVHHERLRCSAGGGSDDAFADGTIRLDSGDAAAVPMPPESVQAPLLAAAEKAMAAPGEEQKAVMPERAWARYDENGRLEGVYTFRKLESVITSRNQTTEQRSSWFAPEFAPWARLPEWVASYLRSSHAASAFMISHARYAEAKAEFDKAKKP